MYSDFFANLQRSGFWAR